MPSSEHEQPRVVDVHDGAEGEEELVLDMFAQLVFKAFSVSCHNIDTFGNVFDQLSTAQEQEI